MPEYPAVMYHEDGRHTVVSSAGMHKALGDGWTEKPNEKAIAGIRRASGAVSETIVPVTRTVTEPVR